MKKRLLVFLLVLTFAVMATLIGCSPAEPNVESLEIKSQPTTVYIQGEKLKLSGSQLFVKYQDNSSETVEITEGMLSRFDPYLVGDQIIRVNYKGKFTTFKVTVLAPRLENVQLLKNDKLKTEYIAEQDVTPDGLMLLLTFAGGEQREVPVTRDMIVGYNPLQLGEQELAVRYTHNEDVYTNYFTVNVSAKTLIGMEISSLPVKRVYYIGDTLDLTGGSLFLRYDNGYPETKDMKSLPGLEAEADTRTASSASTVTLRYGGRTAKFTIEVIVKDVISFEVMRMPTSEQLVNTPLNLNGLRAEVIFSNGQSEIYMVPEKKVYYEGTVPEYDTVYSIYAYGYDTSRPGTTTVKIRIYSGGTLLPAESTVDITVKDKSISALEIYRTSAFDDNGSPLNEANVYAMTTFRPFDDWSYVLVFNNGERYAPRPLEMGIIANNATSEVFGYENPGVVVWEIDYRDDNGYVFDGYYEFEVLPLLLETVSVYRLAGEEYVALPFVEVYMNTQVDTTGLYLRLTFNSGREEYIPFRQDMIDYDSFDSGSLSTTQIPLTVNIADLGIREDVTVPVVILKKVIGSLGIVSLPANRNYLLFNEADLSPSTRSRYFFNYNGLAVDINFDGDSSPTTVTDFSSDDWQFSFSEWTGPDTYGKFYSTGTKRIFLTYIGLDNPETQGVYFEVEVTNRVTGIEFNSYNLGGLYAGAELDLSGRTINVFYENGTVRTIPLTADMVDYDSKNITLGRRDVTITYREDGETFRSTTSIEVYQNEPYAIEIFRLPYVREYVHNQSDTLDTTGMIVNLLYRNGTRTVLAPNEYQCENFSSENLGQVMIVVQHKTYYFEDIFFIEIKEAAVTSIEWVGAPPVVVIQEGVDFAVSTAKTLEDSPLGAEMVRLTYSGGSTDYTEVTLGSIAGFLSIQNYNKYSALTQYPEIVYEESCFLRVEVRVVARTLTAISAEPGQFSVIEYSDLNLSAAKLRLVFDGGLSENVVPLLQEYIAFDPVNNPMGYNKTDTTLGWRDITVKYTYNGVTRQTAVSVNVLPKQLMGISMKDLPKIKYLEGDPLDLTGGSVVIFYNNGTTEILDLRNATVNMPGSSFNINAIRFDNSEFGGLSKLQTIYVNYTWNNTVFETDFDIIMQDRRYALVTFNSNNIYEFVYGALNEDNAPKFTVTGYNAFEDTSRQLTLAHPGDYSKIKIEYVRYEDRLSPRIPGKDYTELPRDVGEYLIVISYDAAAHNDRVHNSFVTSENETRIITIRPKRIYVELEAITKVYGTDNPPFNIVAYGTDSSGQKSLTAEPFAFGEDFLSPYFANQNNNYGSLCYYNGLPINYVRIVTKNASNTVVSIGAGAPSGTYYIEISSIESHNYDIQYLSSVFVIEKRQVAVYANDITVTYGTTAVNYTYSTGQVPDGSGGFIPDSGLYADDVLSGTLMKEGNDNFVGVYTILLGSLGNPNYNVVYNPGVAAKKLTIVKRNIFVRADSGTKIYGTQNPQNLTVNYFSDETCLDSEHAFAFTNDRLLGLGNVITFTVAELRTGVGIYTVTPVITPYSEEDLIAKREETGNNNLRDILGNYNVILISGILQILPRPLQITIASGEKYYGDSDPAAFAYTASAVTGVPDSGLINDIFGYPEVLSGALKRQAGEFIGRYAIEIGTLATLNPNYAMTYNRADFVIHQKDIYIVLDESNLTKSYDGQAPSLTGYRITHRVGGEYVDYSHTYFNSDSVTISFENPSKNIGEYFVSLTNSNPNYRVSFPGDLEYYYTISPREVNITYIDLPDNVEYSGASFVFYAVVNDDDVQFQYNADGSYRTGDDNLPMKDTIEVTLTMFEALNAGSYTVAPVRLSDPNYILSEAAMQQQTFTILKRELVVEILTENDAADEDDGVTFEAVYDNMSVILYENEHYTVHNALSQVPILLNVRVVDPERPDNVYIAPQDVRYAADNVTIISYDIVAEQPANANFSVRMLKEYKYKILPRKVEVTMTEDLLTKAYDNTEPKVDTSMFYIEDMQTSFDLNTISFTFTRVDPTRGNTDVGVYEISLFCSDRNHIVETKGGRIYTYTITKKAVNVELQGSALSKIYDGAPIAFRQENIDFKGMVGATPNIKNYTNPEDLDGMQAWYDYLAQETATYLALLNITFLDKEASRSRVEEAYTAITALRSKYLNPNSERYITPANYSEIMLTIGASSDAQGVNSLVGRFKDVLAYFDNPSYNRPDALAKFSLVTERASRLYSLIDSERNYIAFRIQGEDANITDVGIYKITMTYNDYNRSYTFLNAQTTDCFFEVKIWQITLRTETMTATYGEALPESIPYTVWHGETQIHLPDPRINITGRLIVDVTSKPYGVGEFNVIAQDIETNRNYFIDVAAQKFVVTKAVVTIQLNEYIGTELDPHPDPETRIIYYGQTIGANRFRYWSVVSGLVAPQPGGTVDPVTVINDQNVTYTAMVNGRNITDPEARPDAGIYEVTATGFYAQNYTFETEIGGALVSTVRPGKITINKKALEIESVYGVLERSYGSPLSFSFVGFEYGQNMSVLGPNFRPPVPVDPNSPAFNMLTPASSNEYEVEFRVLPEDENQFTNYVFDVEGKNYKVRVVRAELTMRLVGTGTGGALVAEYGSNPQYQVVYEGFKNGENFSINPQFDFRKEVRDNTPFDESKVISYTPLTNYILRVASVDYTVTPKELFISLVDINPIYLPNPETPSTTPLTINAVFDPVLGMAYIGPYKTKYYYATTTTTNPDTGEEQTITYVSSVDILAGQYWKDNFRFEGFVYGETEDSLFAKNNENDSYYEYADVFVHSINISGDIGEGLSYSLDGFRFIYYDNTPGGENAPNYTLVYREMPLNIYIKAQSVSVDGEHILLEGDGPEALTVKTVMENGRVDTLALNNGYLVYDSELPDFPAGTDINGRIAIRYRREFDINQYFGPERLGGADGAPINNLIVSHIVNETPVTNVPVRIYKKNTVVYNGELYDDNDNLYNYGTAIDATADAISFTDTAGGMLKSYDRIDTSIRFLPGTGNAYYTLIINQDETGSNSLALIFSRSGIRLVSTMLPEGGPIVSETNLSFDGVDIFDGFTHNIRLYYNKRLGTVYIMLDGIMRAASISSESYVFAEESLAGFTVNGATAWVRHFETAKQGYRDNFASLVTSAQNEKLIMYVSSSMATAYLSITRLFSPKVPPTEEYAYDYYFDGTHIGTLDYLGGDLSVSNAGVGVHRAEMVIRKGTEIISKYTLLVQITTATLKGYVGTNEYVSPSSPVSIYSFTPEDPENPDELTMTNAEPESVQKALGFDSVGAEVNYRSITMAFTMDIATINDDYRASQTRNYLKLATNRTAYDPSKTTGPTGASDYGIVLGLNHNRTGALTGYFNTILYVFANNVTYYYDIPQDIQWNDGSVYTVKLVLDDIASRGGYSFKLLVYRNNAIILDLTVDRDFIFSGTHNGSAATLSLNALQTLVRTGSRSAAIKTSDNRVRLYKLNFGDENATVFDYLVDGVYAQKMAGGVTFGSDSAAGTHEISLSDARNNMLYSHYNYYMVEFSASRLPGSAQNRNIIFNIAASERDMNDPYFREARGIRLVYEYSTRTLYFTFFNKLTNFALQKVAGNIDLFDGQRHTLTVYIDRSSIKTSSISGVYTSQTQADANKVTVTLDGVTYTQNANVPSAPLCFPYNASMTGWHNASGNISPVDNISGYQFLKAYNYSSVYVQDALMTVYNYQTAVTGITENIGSRAGDPLI